MPPPPSELSALLYPLVPDSIQHNTQVLSQIRSLTSLFLGVAAGILGLESLWGFGFYFFTQTIISGLIHVLLLQGDSGVFFQGSGAQDVVKGKVGRERVGSWREVWIGSSLWEGLTSFVLTWAGVGGVVR